jgi:lysophospholipase L1-like esterase
MAATVLAGPGQERPWAPLPSPVSAACPAGVCQPAGLQRLAHGVGPLRIVQFGDSHSAAGWLPEAYRDRLAAGLGRPVELTVVAEVGATLASRPPQLPAGAPAPDLIVLAYGTNEGFDDALDLAAYEARLRGEIARLQREAPGAALLLLGPPEALRGEGGGACPDDPEGRWREPALLPLVRDVQYRVAAATGVAFWDWRGRMGGSCAAHRLTLGPEPLMRGDHVHFNEAGADWLGGLLAADLLTAIRGR